MVSVALDQTADDVRTTGVPCVLEDVYREVRYCRACPTMKPHKKGGSVEHGTILTGYLLVGEGPGRGSGEVLLDALRAAGDPRYQDLPDLFYLVDAVRCAPPDPKNEGKTRPPTKTECRRCRPFLQFEIRTLRPRLVITLGARAAESVLMRPVKMTEEHGRRHTLRDIEVLTLAMPTKSGNPTLKKVGLTPSSYTTWLSGLFGSLIDDLRGA